MGIAASRRGEPSFRLAEQLTLITIIFCLALVTRIALAWLLYANGYVFKMGDDDNYYNIAMSIVTKQEFSANGIPTAFRMPMFPLLLASQYALFGSAPGAALLSQIVLSALTVVGTYLLGLRIANAKVGFFAVILVLCDLNLNYYASLLMTETLVTFLLLASTFTLDLLRETGRTRWAVLAGVLLGMTFLTRVNMLLVVPIAVGWLIWTQWTRRRAAYKQSLIIVAIVLTCWGGWIARNALTFGTFIPLTTQTGDVHMGVYNDIVAARPLLGGFGLWLSRPYQPPPGISPTDEVAIDRIREQEVREWIKAHPWTALQLALVQPFHFWHSEVIDLGAFLYPTFGFIGMALVARARQPLGLLWILLAVILTVFTTVSLAIPRYHQPLNPAMAVFTAIALAWVAKQIQQRGVGRKGSYAHPDA